MDGGADADTSHRRYRARPHGRDGASGSDAMPGTSGLEQDRLRLHLHRAARRGGELVALRSFLFAPGNHARRVEKALTLPADAVILDLEDAVAISEKPGRGGWSCRRSRNPGTAGFMSG